MEREALSRSLANTERVEGSGSMQQDEGEIHQSKFPELTHLQTCIYIYLYVCVKYFQ